VVQEHSLSPESVIIAKVEKLGENIYAIDLAGPGNMFEVLCIFDVHHALVSSIDPILSLVSLKYLGTVISYIRYLMRYMAKR
jgi:hypothetical protein